MTRNPSLHPAPLGYGKNGPLTWVAECRVPWEPPGPKRLAMAQWMIDHGSDVHQGGDGPLMRAALNGYRIPMMEFWLRTAPTSMRNGPDSFRSSLLPVKRWMRRRCAGCSSTGRSRYAERAPTRHRPGLRDRDLLAGRLNCPSASTCCWRRDAPRGEGTPAVLEILRGRIDRLG